ncbi:MFS transporter [Streptomyces sp. I05A-00742]|uniref:MFS transporter n=1 Tax=Streptomyces sp. I05A-00742 TaxID=2732853 RepID=UPI0028A2C850|nr:MFS transporter [Streptomyces sp. I05A-00742]
MSVPAPGPRDAAPPTRRGAVLAICCVALMMIGVDVTALNVALPAIQRDLGSSVAGMQWAVDAYSLSMATLMLLAGSTGDRIGRRRVLRAGLLLFTAASVLCALAPSMGALIGFRVLQGIGAAGLGPVSMSIIAHTFTDRAERTRAMGVWMGAYGLGLAIGPLVGGLLVAAVGWRAVFWLNLPIGLAALALAGRYVRESRSERPRRSDAVGQLLVITLLGPLTYAVIEAPHTGWTSPVVLAALALAVASLVGLVGYEGRRDEPLIELRLFRDVRFSGAIAAGMCVFGAFGGFFFLSALRLQNPLGLSALKAGLWMLPPSAVLAVCSLCAARLAERYGTRPLLVLAGGALAASGALAAVLAGDPSALALVAEFVFFGIGIGLASPLLITAGVSGLPPDRAGLASGLFTSCGRSAFSLGVAVLGAILAAGLHGAPLHDPAAFASAARPAWAIVAACGVVVAVLAAVSTAGGRSLPGGGMAGGAAESAESVAPGAADRRAGRIGPGKRLG